ncbi:MAG: allose kinase [Clostridiales bacterium]|nr:allose kinase [Clostridiales bacterium]
MINTKDRVLALDIGGTNTRLGLVGRDGSLVGYRRLKSSLWNKKDPMKGLVELIKEYLSEESPQGVAALSLGFPGAVDKGLRTLVNVPTIPSLDGMPVADLLEAALRTPVYLDRDVVTLYAHAAQALALPKQGMTLCFFIGTGIGNLIVLDGRPWTGQRGVAGELGHIPLYGKDLPCGCGQVGCAELYAAGHALVRMRSEHFPGEDPDLLFPLHLNHPAVQEFLDTLAQVIATEMVILDPDRALLGGGIIQMPEFPLQLLQDKVVARLRGGQAPGMTWHLAPDAQRAGVIGAGLNAFDRMDREAGQ